MTLCILGSTGSVGTQTLEVASHLGARVAFLAAGRNSCLMEQQARAFAPLAVAMGDPSAAADLRVRLADTSIRVLSGSAGICELAADCKADTVVTALTGIAGLAPTLSALEGGRRVALAGKEALVCAGRLIMDAAKAQGSTIIPVDSEHSAIFQCLEAAGEANSRAARLVLTASGGPFYGWTRKQLQAVTPAQAMNHPTWRMGGKITLDSATMVNKGLECIEAVHLFDIPIERIQVVVHRQSIVHSMVVFEDGSTLAQLGTPDMRLPIQYALTYPKRQPTLANPPDWSISEDLTFAPLDDETFPAVRLAREAVRAGGTAPTVYNAAAEVAGRRFLAGRIRFTDIADCISKTLATVPVRPLCKLDDAFDADALVRDGT